MFPLGLVDIPPIGFDAGASAFKAFRFRLLSLPSVSSGKYHSHQSCDIFSAVFLAGLVPGDKGRGLGNGRLRHVSWILGLFGAAWIACWSVPMVGCWVGALVGMLQVVSRLHGGALGIPPC